MPRLCIPLVLTLVVALIAPAPLPAQSAGSDMPTEITERLWRDPGPEQDGPGAPRLMVVYPAAAGGPYDGEAMRYAGRVDPEDATVTLNGDELQVYPGGVFTGLRRFGDAESETWTFRAAAGGKTTTVSRSLRIRRPTPPPAHWPLQFASWPHSPSGLFVLPEGEELEIKLFGSPGHSAEYRIGEAGAWRAMTPAEPHPRLGGVYTASLTPPLLDDAGPRTVHFRLSGSHEGRSDRIERASALRVAARPDGVRYAGRVTNYLANYLKHSDPENWDRYGQLVKGTPFPVTEVRGDRCKADFGRGETGWLELEHVKIDWEPFAGPAPRLDETRVVVTSDSLTLAWPDAAQPVLYVFDDRSHAGPEHDVRLSLPGADESMRCDPPDSLPGGPVDSLQFRPAEGAAAPAFLISLTRPLWGYSMLAGASDEADQPGLRFVLRTRPRLPAATAAKPLAGARIMLDAGHGGDDLGAIGPSGLVEADLNLVQAAWVQTYLEELGAEVEQTRRSHATVDLDERALAAHRWDPDLFVSLHHNSVGFTSDPLADSGPIVFYHYDHARPVAETVGEALTSAIAPDRSPRVNSAVFRVARNVLLAPSILIETGYVCNPHDEAALRRTESIKQSARAIAEGIRAALTEPAD